MDTAQPSSPARVIAAAILLVTLVGVALSVSNPLLSLEMERWGVASTVAGLTASAAGLGTVLAVPLVPRTARWLGVPLTLGIGLVMAATGMLLFWLWPNLAAWTILRFALGCAIGVVFTLSEFWINAAADPARRGTVMGIYATALYAGFATGPLLLVQTGTTGLLPYALTAGLITLGLIPLLLAGRGTPKIETAASHSVLRFILSAPTATVGALVFGAAETGIIIQLPVHNVRLGYSEHEATLLLSAITLGNVLMQVPLGWLSDKMDRRRLLFLLATGSALLSVALVAGPPGFWRFAVLLFALGGVGGAIYTVGLAHLGSRFTGADLAAANAAFILLYSVGLMVGPPAIGVGMDLAGALGLPVALALMFGGYALLVLWRIRVHGKA